MRKKREKGEEVKHREKEGKKMEKGGKRENMEKEGKKRGKGGGERWKSLVKRESRVEKEG